MPEPQEVKRCRKCGVIKPLAFFSIDRSRPDGHWHTCKACNRLDWQARGKVQALQKRLRKRYSGSPRAGLRGLKHKRYRHRGPRFSSLAPQLQPIAERLLSGYRFKHAQRMRLVCQSGFCRPPQDREKKPKLRP